MKREIIDIEVDFPIAVIDVIIPAVAAIDITVVQPAVAVVEVIYGEKGDTGDQGPQGETGPQGPAGPAGADSTVPGPQGPQGEIGPQGPKGDTGATGATGAQGPQGPTGATGPEGPQGESGSTILSGTTLPGPATGVEGDYYVHAGLAMYGPKQGAWAPQEYLLGTPPTMGPNPANYRLGVSFEFHVDVLLVGARFWRISADAALSHTAVLMDSLYNVVATTLPTTETASNGWVDAVFDPPLVLAPGIYRLYHDTGGYSYDPIPLDIVNPAHATWISGHFGAYGGPGFPGSTDTGNSYNNIQPVFQPASTNAWPVGVPGWIQVTQAEYDALPVKNPALLYVVIG